MQFLPVIQVALDKKKVPPKPQTNHNKEADKNTCWILGVSTNTAQEQGRAMSVSHVGLCCGRCAQNVYKMKHFATVPVKESIRKMNIFILKVFGPQIR